MKSEQMTIERQLNLESLTDKDFTPVSFKKLFPAIMGDANAYKLWNSDLANAINITIIENFDLKKDGKEDEARIGDLNKKIQEYVDFIGNSYQKGNFSQKVNILDFINSNAFIPFKYDQVKLGFRDQLIQKVKEIFQDESKEKGNYFLYTYLSSFFENDIKMDEIVSKEYKLASKDRYIKENGTELLISKLGKKERVDYLLNKVETLVLGENWDSEEMLKGEGELFKCYEELESLFDKFSSEDISIIGAKKDINETEEQNIKDYSIFLNEKVQLVFKKEFGLPLSELSLQEQLALIGYFKNSTNENVAIKKDFAKKYGINGLRTFLSIEQEKKGENMGDKILALGEKLPEKSAKILFKTYSEIVDAIEEVDEIFSKKLGEKASPEMIHKVKESLLFAGKDLLDRYAGKASVCEGEDCKKLGKDLAERLSLAKTTTFAFSYVCKILVERGEFNFNDFEKVKLSYDKSPLPEKKQEKIMAMHQENTKQYPEKIKNLWRGTMKDGLSKENPDQLIVSVSYDDEELSVMRVIKQEDGSWYGASFNVNPTVQGSRVGTELQKRVMEDLARDKPFVADCWSKNPMLENYLNKFGFKITKEIENYHDTGELVYEITIFPNH